MAAQHYGARQPEFAVMSLKPGIGQGWYQQYREEVYPSDFVILEEERPPPRYYDELYARSDEAALEAVKSRRLALALKHRANQTPERLKARAECLRARINLRKGQL